VWTLSGRPDTWAAQLDRRLAENPVFAVVAGIGGATWEPIHAFCERANVPCLFPNTDLPVVADRDYYPLYFCRGVLLESDLIAKSIMANDMATDGRIVEVYRDGDIGEKAALALSKALGPSGRQVRLIKLAGPDARKQLATALQQVTLSDRLVLWLRPRDLQSLPDTPPLSAASYVSGIMAGLESAPLAPAWHKAVLLTYPYDLPDARQVRVDYARRWFAIAGIPMMNERVQVDTYLACQILAESLGHMQDSFVRDYLVERVENLVGHRLVNGYYPRLSLGPSQRFASKGGYNVRFTTEKGADIAAEGPWTAP
jgi:hypothetical protein